MHCLKKEEMYQIAPILDGWNETLLWSCLQGYMGNAWTDEIQNPKSAQIITGDFCFFAGVPNNELVKNIPEFFSPQCIVMVPQNDEWANLIEMQYKSNCQKFMRYAIKKEPDIFDTDKLHSYLEMLPSEYSIQKIDEKRYYQVMAEEWSKDLCSQFPTYKDFEKFGLGFVVLRKDEIVCGASSYTVYEQGIEIEIDTKKDYRRKGLALVCASKLILACLDRGALSKLGCCKQSVSGLGGKIRLSFRKRICCLCDNEFQVNR